MKDIPVANQAFYIFWASGFWVKTSKNYIYNM